MKVIEGRQIAFGTYREVGIQTPKSVPTTSCPVVGLADCSVVTDCSVVEDYSVVADCSVVAAKDGSVFPETEYLHVETMDCPVLETKEQLAQPATLSSVKPNLISVRSGQSEMTLEELFGIGRKEEEQ